MNILRADFNTKDRLEDNFTSTMKNQSLHEIGNDNGVRRVKLATSKTPDY